MAWWRRNRPDRKRIDELVELYRQGRLEQAAALGETLADRYPRVALIPGLLGRIYADQQRYDAAVSSYRTAIALHPDDFEVRYNLGMALNAMARYEAALDCIQQVLAAHPDASAAHVQLGIAYAGLGRYPEALSSLQQALTLNPQEVAALNNLGIIHANSGRYAEALAYYDQALRLRPNDAALHNNIGGVLKTTGRNAEAVAYFRKALSLNPALSAIHSNLGHALKALGDYAEAADSYRSALAIFPDDAAAHDSLGFVLRQLGDNEAALASFRRAVALDPRSLFYRGSLLQQRAVMCDWSEPEGELPSELAHLTFGSRPDATLSPFLLLSLTDDARLLRRAAEAFVAANFPAQADRALEAVARRGDGTRIRIGYFSADFHAHATMYLMAGLFERHDRSAFEIHVFSFGPAQQDAMRKRLVDCVDGFHDVRLMGDEAVVRLSRSLGIDIAVDLKGYTRNHRLQLFALRPAPVSVSYLGYPGTLGAPYMDYLVADRVLIPPGRQAGYTEQIVYLPDSYQVNDDTRKIPRGTATRRDLGLPERGFVFCCFNNNYKIRPVVFDVWMRLLQRVEGSVLWLLRDNPVAERNLREAAARRGVDPARLVFAERLSWEAHMDRHRLADLFLDTFNYNAHTTASDALWAGLPVVTMTGGSFASRVAASLLSALALSDLIADTTREYEELAVRLASHPAELDRLKQRLAENLKTTALFDTARFTRHLEAAYRQMFERHAAGLPPAPIQVLADRDTTI